MMKIGPKIDELRDNLTESNIQSTLDELYDLLYMRYRNLGKVDIKENRFEYNNIIGESIDKVNGIWVYVDIQVFEEPMVSYTQAKKLLNELGGFIDI